MWTKEVKATPEYARAKQLVILMAAGLACVMLLGFVLKSIFGPNSAPLHLMFVPIVALYARAMFDFFRAIKSMDDNKWALALLMVLYPALGLLVVYGLVTS